MIRRILHIARREWLELGRQHAMLGVIGGLFLLIAGVDLAAVALLQVVEADPVATGTFETWLGALGIGVVDVHGVVGLVVNLGNFLLFTQYLGFASVLAGHTVLHDRQCHTLPFLLLAPVRRTEVIVGKVLGAIGLPTVLYVAVDVAAMGLARSLPVSAPHAALLPPSPGWLVAALLGGPVWALAVGIVCATVSAMSRDVRTAQQVVWFVMFFATFSAGYLLAGRVADGAVVQLGVAALGALLAGGALLIGARVISRDLAR